MATQTGNETTDLQHITILKNHFRLADKFPKVIVRFDYDRQLYHRVFEVKVHFLGGMCARNLKSEYTIVAAYPSNNKAIRVIVVPNNELKS